MKFIIGTCTECKSIVAGSLDMGTPEEKAEWIAGCLEHGLEISTVEEETIKLKQCEDSCSRK